MSPIIITISLIFQIGCFNSYVTCQWFNLEVLKSYLNNTSKCCNCFQMSNYLKTNHRNQKYFINSYHKYFCWLSSLDNLLLTIFNNLWVKNLRWIITITYKCYLMCYLMIKLIESDRSKIISHKWEKYGFGNSACSGYEILCKQQKRDKIRKKTTCFRNS